MSVDAEELREVREEFERCVNMTNRELERWLQTDESQSVGWDEDRERMRWLWTAQLERALTAMADLGLAG